MKTIFEIGLREEGKRLSLRKNDYDALLFRVGGVIGTEIIFVSKEQALELAAAINKEYGGPVEGKPCLDYKDALIIARDQIWCDVVDKAKATTIAEHILEALKGFGCLVTKEAKPTPVDDYPDGWYEAKFANYPNGDTTIVRKLRNFWYSCGNAMPQKFESLIILAPLGELRE